MKSIYRLYNSTDSITKAKTLSALNILIHNNYIIISIMK